MTTAYRAYRAMTAHEIYRQPPSEFEREAIAAEIARLEAKRKDSREVRLLDRYRKVNG